VDEVARDDQHGPAGAAGGSFEDVGERAEVAEVPLKVGSNDEPTFTGKGYDTLHDPITIPSRERLGGMLGSRPVRQGTTRRTDWARALARAAILGAGVGAAACSGGAEPDDDGLAPSQSAPIREDGPRESPRLDLRRTEADPNPLKLPARKLDLAAGSRVFTVPEVMLRGAKLGSAFSLRAATITGRDGDDFIVDGRDGPPYRVHAAYVIPLVPLTRPKLEAPVVAEWAGALRHGVIRRLVKDKIVVRFTDAGDKSERTLSAEQMMLQKDGFHSGNYAVRRSGADYVHLLLVSPLGESSGDWLAIGYGGATQVVAERDLLAVPVSYLPKVGTSVWAEHLGKMRDAKVTAVDRPGLCDVRFDRAGKSVVVGWGLVMPPGKN
jgi:hypothetical protein